MRVRKSWLILLSALAMMAWPLTHTVSAQDSGDDTTAVDDDGTTDDGTTDDGTTDEAAEVWDEIVGDAVLEHDTENNTITVGVTHASFWAVMDGNTVEPVATAVQATGWGALKRGTQR